MGSSDRSHSSKPAKPRAASKSHQESFCLIAHRVPCGDAVAPILTRGVEQKAISDLTGRFFKSATRRFGFTLHIDCAYG
jgi:hypothetical protein